MKNLFYIALFNAAILFSQETANSNQTKIDVFFMKDYGESELFAKEVVSRLELVINSEAFRDSLLSTKMTRKGDISNNELYKRILAAHELNGPGKIKGENYVMDIGFRTLNLNDDDPIWVNKRCVIGSKTGTIGLEGGIDGITKICPQHLQKFKKDNNKGGLGGHYMHEYMHMLGFRHRWYSKYKSAVYKIGNLVEKIINENIDLVPVNAAE
ncbi:hypothetical protein NYZ99_15540 [Maribacter litopenaei]|uniref:Uncharacterized protein n=1 Tax=Maribacter litopenaei TaxID=2976127 RepID=A0ABY5Y643_9FLAO|nr:hypothetical protein [Maribacter litopenaei]UWX54349.1 hypothetical protein NYZ99_15540 [Maribacter litopenaei]